MEGIKLQVDTMWCTEKLNPWAAQLFASIFHLFEAGIADAISSFKWR